MSSTTYQRRKAAGQCVWCEGPVTPPHVYCDACLEHKRVHQLPLHVREPIDERNQIAHCGAFRPITALPWQCPVCQAVLLEERTG